MMHTKDAKGSNLSPPSAQAKPKNPEDLSLRFVIALALIAVVVSVILISVLPLIFDFF